MGRWLVMLVLWVGAVAPAYAQLQPGDVPSNEDLLNTIDPNILGDVGDMPPVPFDPANPGNYGGCNGDAACEDIMNDLGGSAAPDMTDIDAIVQDARPGSDPMAEIGSDIPMLSETCESGTDAVTQTTTDTFEYRCNSGTNIVENESRCNLVLVHTIEPGYVYECPVTRDENGVIVVSDECELLDGDPSCVLESSTCTDDNGVQLEEISCRTGPPTIETTPSCERERVHEISLQFIYECEFVLNESTGTFEPDAQCQALIDDGRCVQGGQDCSDLLPPEREEISCMIGNELVYSDEACSAKLQTVIDEDYFWDVKRIWANTSTLYKSGGDKEPKTAAEKGGNGSWGWFETPEWRAAEAAGCGSDGEVCTVPEPVVMETLSCQIGYRIDSSTEQCVIEREVVTDDDYIYEGQRVWNASLSGFRASSGWNVLNSDNDCALQGSACSVPTITQYEQYRCEEGYRVDVEGVSCVNPRVITIDTDYQYMGHRNFNQARGQFKETPVQIAAKAASCVAGAQTCAEVSPGVFSEQVCERGYEIEYDQHALKRDVVVVTDDDYIYEAKETWNGSGFSADQARITLTGQRSNCQELTRVCTQTGPGVFSDYVCTQGYRDTFTESQCAVPRVISVDRDYLYQANRNFQYGVDRWNDTAQLAALRASSSCTFNNQQCVRTSPGVFDTLTCQIGTRTDYTIENGTRLRETVVDEDYIYERNRTWNGSTHARVADWAPLNNDATCQKTASVCAVSTPAPYDEYTCNSGYQDNETSPSCARERQVSVDLDYQYSVGRTWNTSTNNWASVSDWNKIRTQPSCIKQSESCALESPGVTTPLVCQRGYRHDETAMSCDDVKSFTVETDYRYVGYENWNGSSYVKDTTLTKIGQQASSKSCVRESVLNQQGLSTAARTSKYECLKGTIAYAPVLTETTCSVPRVITTGNVRWYAYELYSGDDDVSNIDSDCTFEGSDSAGDDEEVEYWHCPRDQTPNIGYTGSTVWKSGVTSDTLNTAACGSAITNGATLVSEVCTQGPQTRTIGGLPVTRSCWNYSRDYQSGGTGQSCEASLSVSVVNNSAYVYEQGEYRPNRQYYYPYGPMRSNSACTYKSQRIVNYNWGSFRFVTYHCSSAQTGAAYKGRAGNSTITDNWDTSACTAAASQGNLISSLCLEGPASRSINGESVQRDCWKELRSYSGPDPEVTIDSCAPPSGFVYKRQTSYTASPALGSSNTLKKREYEKVESLSGSTNIVAPYTCLTGYWINAAGQQKTYSCSPPSGAVQKSSVCAWHNSSGSCKLYARSYTVPNPGPPGGYNRHKETWTCGLAVTGSGVASPQILRTKKADTWNKAACASARTGYSQGCVQTSAAYYGGSTNKTVNGLTLNDRWTYRRNYTCTERTDIDTCGSLAFNEYGKPSTQFASNDNALSVSSLIPDFTFKPSHAEIKPTLLKDAGQGAAIILVSTGDTTFDSQTCLAYVNGVCTLWERHYEREEVDPSGGCHDEREVWRCENAVSGVGSATILREVVGETFSNTACQALVNGHDSCTLIRQTEDLTTGGTRTVNGLPVNRPFWAYKRDYECTDRVTTETCSPPSGAVIHDVECLWQDESDICRLVKRNYRIPLADPSGGCTTFKDTFRCEEQNHGIAQAKAHDIISDKWIRPANYPSTRGCVRQSYTWGPTETRVINGLSLTRKWAINEVFECSQAVPVDTCSPLPTGATQLGGSICQIPNRDGSCGVYEKSYRYPVDDASGGCLEYREEYACTDIVAGTGEPVAIPRTLESQDWNTQACDAVAANDSCELLTDTCVEGPETRTIDGLPVFQSCWKKNRVYECSSRQDVNTCSPPAGATLDDSECIWTDRAGVCRLHRKTFLLEEHDPSGGCSEYTSDFRCENTVASLPIKETISHYVSAHYDVAPYHALRANYDRCVYQGSNTCVEGAETRIINGVDVSRNCWSSEFDYECENKTTVDTCGALYDRATSTVNECLWTDRAGVCRLKRHTLTIPEDDPSGGCLSYATPYTCEEELTSGSTTFEPFNILKGIATNDIDTSACSAAIEGQGTCREVSTTCSEPNETRMIDGLAVTQNCWAYEVNYDCSTTLAINTCEIPAGAIADGTNCLWSDSNGVCRLEEKIFKVALPDPTHGCSEWTDTFRCEEQQTGAGAIVDTVSHVLSITWDQSACAAIDIAGRACQQTEACSSGLATRVINGVSVTEQCWERTRDYSCTLEVPVDTCNVPYNANETSSSCALTGSDGQCILYDREYEWRVRDGSGGCHEYTQRVYCDDRSVIARTPDAYGYEIGVTTLDMTGCGAIPANDNTCRETSRVCTDSNPKTRRPTHLVDANGELFVPADPSAIGDVTKQCWEYEVTYQCEQSTPVDECTSVAAGACTLDIETCAQEDRDGGCARVERTYSCEIEGTGGCISQTTTFTCDIQSPEEAAGQSQQAAKTLAQKALDIPVAQKASSNAPVSAAANSNEPPFEPVDVIATFERAYWDNTNCAIRDNDAGCELISTTCVDEGSGSAQAIRRAQDDYHQGYIQYADTVVEPCWEEQKVYQCGASSILTDCTDESDRCEHTETECLLTGDDGECLLSEASYQCGAAQCDSSRRVCDFRYGKDKYEGYKYTCNVYSETRNGGLRGGRDDCVGLTGCQYVETDKEIYEDYYDSGDYYGDNYTYRSINTTRAYYCDTEMSGLGPLVTAHGYKHDGADAESESCTALDNDTSCTVISDLCVEGNVTLEDETGTISEYCSGGRRKIYDCGQSDPNQVCSGQCTNWQDTYTCESAIDGVDPVQVTDPEILSRVDASACDALNDNERCIVTDEVCVEGEETRLLDGIPVHASCWRWERTFTCAEDNGFETDCEVPSGCELVTEECLAELGDGSCGTTEHLYSCTETEEVVVSEAASGTCGDETPADPYADPNESGEPEGSSLFGVIAGLNSVKEGSEDHRSEPKLFAGEPLKCGKLIFGAKNCCKRSGLLIGLGCNADEKKLALAKEDDRCISVGSYCSKKAFFGTCLTKKETSCCYTSELARIVAETGMQQLGKTLGTPKNPQCDGFSVQQFQLLDLSQADFSSVADSMIEDMNLGNPDEIAARLSDRIRELQGGGG